MGDLESHDDDADQAELNDQKLNGQPEPEPDHTDHTDLARLALGEMDLDLTDLDISQELQINGELPTDNTVSLPDSQLALGEDNMDYGDRQDTTAAEDTNLKELLVDQRDNDDAQVDYAQQDPEKSDEGGQGEYPDKARSQEVADEEESEESEEYQLAQTASGRQFPIEVHLQPPSDPESYQRLPLSWTVETVLSELQLEGNIFYEVEFDDGRIDQVRLAFMSKSLPFSSPGHITYPLQSYILHTQLLTV